MTSWTLFAALLCLAGLVATNAQRELPCPKPCPRMYFPVCAEHRKPDGSSEYRIFPNDCMMYNQNCLFRGDWKPVSKDHCYEKEILHKPIHQKKSSINSN